MGMGQSGNEELYVPCLWQSRSVLAVTGLAMVDLLPGPLNCLRG